MKRKGSIERSSPKKKAQTSTELKIGDTMKLDKSNISKNEKSATMTSQSDFMKNSYIRLERRNTRFKLETINASEAPESVKQTNSDESSRKHLTNKQSVQIENILDDLPSDNQTDPQ